MEPLLVLIPLGWTNQRWLLMAQITRQATVVGNPPHINNIPTDHSEKTRIPPMARLLPIRAGRRSFSTPRQQ